MKLVRAVTLIAAASASPVENVVTLLEGLKTRIEADGEKELKMYDKFACWCETTTGRKAAAIHDARDEMRRLGQQILSLKGEIAEGAAKIEELMKDLEENHKAQAEATSIRAKENKVFMEESGEMKKAMGALEKAKTVLVTGTGLLQISALKAVQALPTKMIARMPSTKLSVLQQYASSLSHNSAGYTPQSATIQKILNAVYDTFAEDLKKLTNEEGSKNGDFEEFITVKQEEEIEMSRASARKMKAKADAEASLSEATQTYDDTDQQMKADVEFFDKTQKTCKRNNKMFEERKKSRQSEVDGIKKALEILTSDEAREMFSKSFKSAASFVQVEALTSSPIQHAYQTLKAHASKTHSLRLARLAAEVHSATGGRFDKVIKAIDDLVQTLKDEEKSDIEKRDECKDNYQEIQSTVNDLDWKIEKNEAKINKLEEVIEEKREEKKQTVKRIEETLAEIKEMEDTRKEENDEFKEAKSDDEKAIELLGKAKDALSEYYKKNFFLQEPDFKVSEDQAPEFELSGKSKRKNESGGIIGLMETLIEDLKIEVKNGEKEEEEAQLDFEDNLAAAKKLVKDLRDKKTSWNEQIAEHDGDKTDEEEDKKGNNKDLDNEQEYKADIKPDCDFIVGSFAARAERREAEMNGLVEAKQFLSGSQLLQIVLPHAHLRGSL